MEQPNLGQTDGRNERTNERVIRFFGDNDKLLLLRREKENNKTSRPGLTYLYENMPYSLFGKSCSLFLQRIEMLSEGSSFD